MLVNLFAAAAADTRCCCNQLSAMFFQHEFAYNIHWSDSCWLFLLSFVLLVLFVCYYLNASVHHTLTHSDTGRCGRTVQSTVASSCAIHNHRINEIIHNFIRFIEMVREFGEYWPVEEDRHDFNSTGPGCSSRISSSIQSGEIYLKISEEDKEDWAFELDSIVFTTSNHRKFKNRCRIILKIIFIKNQKINWPCFGKPAKVRQRFRFDQTSRNENKHFNGNSLCIHSLATVDWVSRERFKLEYRCANSASREIPNLKKMVEIRLAIGLYSSNRLIRWFCVHCSRSSSCRSNLLHWAMNRAKPKEKKANSSKNTHWRCVVIVSFQCNRQRWSQNEKRFV